MNLSTLTDPELHARTVDLARREQAMTLDVIAHLEEVTRRRLFAARGFSSPFEYCVKALGYSEPGAAQRVAAMRLQRDVPEAREALRSGTLSLTTAATVQRFIQREEKRTGAKLGEARKTELVQTCSGLPTRAVERKLAAESPQAAPPERLRPIAPGVTEVRFPADDELVRLIARARDVRGGSAAEVLKWALGVALDRHDAVRKANRATARQATRTEKAKSAGPSTATPPASAAPRTSDASALARFVDPRRTATPAQKGTSAIRYVPAQAKHEAVMRAGGRCEWVDAATGRRCESTYRLEFDHVVPVALGGGATTTGTPGRSAQPRIRILCRSHNATSAIEWLGPEVMAAYLPGLRP
jgi:hypothetical protein